MIEIIFELGINLIESLIIIEFVTKYLGSRYLDSRRITSFVCAWAVSFAEVSVINHITAFEGFAMGIHVLVVFIYCIIALEGKWLLKLWISALTQFIIVIIAIGTNLVMCEVIGYDPNDMIAVFNSKRVIGVLITKVLFFYITRLMLRYKYKNPLDNQLWIMLIVIPLISIISISALMIAALNHDKISGYILCGISGILVANIITYYLFTSLNKDYETKLKIKLLEQNSENAVKNLESTNAFVAEMRTVRHDINNQLVLISEYIKKGRYNDAQNYVDGLMNNYMPELQEMINSDSDAFNAIVNSKIAICNQKRIHIEVKATQGIFDMIAPDDICIMFGNLLDNAIEAADNTKNKRITVDVQILNGYVSALVTNSISKSVLASNETLQTSKKDKQSHGIGIKSIKNIVKKYNGIINFFEEQNEFCCHILLDAVKSAQ